MTYIYLPNLWNLENIYGTIFVYETSIKEGSGMQKKIRNTKT